MHDLRAVCQRCAFFEGGCAVYPNEAIVDPYRTTCNEHRQASGFDQSIPPPPPGFGVFDLHEGPGGAEPRLRPPQAKRGESPGGHLARLGGLLRARSRLGGHAVVGDALSGLGVRAYGELRRSILQGAAPEGRVVAFDALEATLDPRLPALFHTLSDDANDLVRGRAVLALTRLDDPLAPDLTAALTTASDAQAREFAATAQAYLDRDWDRVRRTDRRTRADALALRRRFRVLGALTGVLLGAGPGPLHDLLHTAARARPVSPQDLAEGVFRDAPTAARCATAVLPAVLRRSLPDAEILVGQACAWAQLPEGHAAAALLATHLTRRALAAEHPDPETLYRHALQLVQHVHPGTARLVRATTPLAPGRPPRITNAAQALVWGLRAPAADILGERLNLPPELRACAGLGFGLLHGPGPFAEDPLAQLGTPTLELVSKLASTTLLEKVE